LICHMNHRRPKKCNHNPTLLIIILSYANEQTFSICHCSFDISFQNKSIETVHQVRKCYHNSWKKRRKKLYEKCCKLCSLERQYLLYCAERSSSTYYWSLIVVSNIRISVGNSSILSNRWICRIIIFIFSIWGLERQYLLYCAERCSSTYYWSLIVVSNIVGNSSILSNRWICPIIFIFSVWGLGFRAIPRNLLWKK
jgi:hypothetical protein